jgi:hypothetical protein
MEMKFKLRQSGIFRPTGLEILVGLIFYKDFAPDGSVERSGVKMGNGWKSTYRHSHPTHRKRKGRIFIRPGEQNLFSEMRRREPRPSLHTQ